ncbi:bulb-type lectin domain-containing protein [Chryseobacterium sp. NRRL B-14859]|uniref:bulb-type lectin domain-containing protein n=1 Tax=unclassified Chryseobacterium TaxID=2593645 RepID=UPI003340F6AF
MKKELFAMLGLLAGICMMAQNFTLGTNLIKDRKYQSENRQHFLIFQNDGNLVVYNRRNQPQWDSKTQGKGARAIFQEDGNLVVYNFSDRPVFSTNTVNKNATSLEMQDDGNLVIYNRRGNALWSSYNDPNRNDFGGNGNFNNNTGSYSRGNIYKGYEFVQGEKIYSENSKYYLIFQTDGNLVMYRSGFKKDIWSTATAGKGRRAVFQEDGNLVVYDSSNRAVYNTGVSLSNVDRLSIQNDGNIVIYNYDNQVVWADKR